MFTLNADEITKFGIGCADDFITFWSKFYKYGVKIFHADEPINYFSELNIGQDLTEENICRLLRWKDPHQLTQRILSGPNAGQDNPRVVAVLRHLDVLNRFRRNETSEEEMKSAVGNIFPNGIVFQVFLLHIALPHKYPIADRYVFRACEIHTQNKIEQTWQGYRRYSDYFSQIASTVGVLKIPSNIAQLKKIDNALWAFGKFLNSYHRK